MFHGVFFFGSPRSSGPGPQLAGSDSCHEVVVGGGMGSRSFMIYVDKYNNIFSIYIYIFGYIMKYVDLEEWTMFQY